MNGKRKIQHKNKNNVNSKNKQQKSKSSSNDDDKPEKKTHKEEKEIKSLTSLLWPNFGEEKKDISPCDIETFNDLPISQYTLKGLTDAKFVRPTDIQKESLMYALKGHDILGAAKTGSGKTLAFLIPVLELLYRQRYSPGFGLAAVIISPTRELAFQSFDTLRKIGKYHDISFGLVTGGKFLREESKHIRITNVIISTPGRFKQHLEKTPNFNADEVKILVLDEADQILKMGFADTMNAVLESLPPQKQTLLFSATQTKSVKDLARLSLKRPIYVSAHEKAKETTPTTLEQRYIVCPMEQKISILWSFVRTHKHQKILTFMSCCKEVRYIYSVFKTMRPGLSVYTLHGHMKMTQRMIMFSAFTHKKHALLLATDIAARGLDFPSVDWVIQVDKPESVDTYIHRVGRSARYGKFGQALMFLLPSEEKHLADGLMKRKIPINKMNVNKAHVYDITEKLEALCASRQELRDFAQKAFLSVMKNLSFFDKIAYKDVNQEAFAKSLGLVQVPQVKKFKTKFSEESDSEGNDSDDGSINSSGSSNEDKIIKSDTANGSGLNFHIESDDEKEIAFYDVKKSVNPTTEENEESMPIKEGKRKKKSVIKEKMRLLKQAKRTTFDEDGNLDVDDEIRGLNIEKAKKRMETENELDKLKDRERIKEMHRTQRLKRKEEKRQQRLKALGISDEQGSERETRVVVLGRNSDDESGDNFDEHESDQEEGENKDQDEESNDGENDSEVDEDDNDADDDDDDDIQSDDDNDSDDEPVRKRFKQNNRYDSDSKDSEDEQDSSDEESDGDASGNLKLTEEAALALLN